MLRSVSAGSFHGLRGLPAEEGFFHTQQKISILFVKFALISSLESQKGAITIHRWSVENQKGAIVIDIVQ